MQTRFTPQQLGDPKLAEANQILRTCVHCGFCTATCPTYLLRGNENDSPRGRIYMIKAMLEQGEAASADTVKHIDRCLSCLSCMTTCPSGVDYRHLLDQARVHVEQSYKRPLADRFMRGLLSRSLPSPRLFRLSLALGQVARPLAGLLSALGARRLAALLQLAQPPRSQATAREDGTHAAQAVKKGRVALLKGCVQSVVDPAINQATIRLLTRLGYEVVVADGTTCCGSLELHMGREEAAKQRARAMIDGWLAADVQAVISTASGCGSSIGDYHHLLKDDAAYAGKAKTISELSSDITSFLARQDLPACQARNLQVTYHAACSLQHGQKVKSIPQALLRQAGFTVRDIAEAHICCGSAGTYNILQPEIATELRQRKLQHIMDTAPQVIATGNIGCMVQLQSGTAIPIVHTVQLLDWAYGGPCPKALQHQGD